MTEYINTDQIKEGMVLADDIINQNGYILVTAGTEIKSNHIRVFKTWGIDSVAVSDKSNEDITDISPAARQVCLDIINKMIKWKPKNIMEENLIESAVYRIAEMNIMKNRDEYN